MFHSKEEMIMKTYESPAVSFIRQDMDILTASQIVTGKISDKSVGSDDLAAPDRRRTIWN